MRLSRHKHETLPRINMTPMIDVVMLLLIFFMTVSEISRQYELQVKLPELEGVDNQPPSELTIHVAANGRLFMDEQPRDAAWIQDRLREAIEAAGDPQRVMVVVRCDRRSDSAAVNELVRRMQQLDIKQIRFAVQKP